MRGSFDDTQTAGFGDIPDSVHWFRVLDNDPVAIDSQVIEMGTYSRSLAPDPGDPNGDLPVGHSWAASANFCVAEALGWNDTQAVMYSHQTKGQVFYGAVADDVNTIRNGQTGADRLAATDDDYTIRLALVPDCSSADVRVGFRDAGDPPLQTDLPLIRATLRSWV